MYWTEDVCLSLSLYGKEVLLSLSEDFPKVLVRVGLVLELEDLGVNRFLVCTSLLFLLEDRVDYRGVSGGNSGALFDPVIV
jgi:hypothetical protein